MKFPECRKLTVSGVVYFCFFSHSGKDDTWNVYEYLSCITKAIQEKAAVVFVSAHFFATLSDYRQAWKTTLEKELVMVHVERNGKILFLIWLQCHV